MKEVIHKVKCPHEYECKRVAGYCHRWKHQTFSRENGELVAATLIYECKRPLIKK